MKAQFSDQFYLPFFSTFFSFLFQRQSVHNFADNKTFASFASTRKELLSILELECETGITWLHNNKMIVNPEKF